MRRAAEWDGAVPLFESARHGQAPSPDEVRDLVDYIARHRGDQVDGPFDVVVGGASQASTTADLIGPLRETGATWWDERQVQTNPDHYRAEPVLRRIEAGPPAIE
jgi:hypothetical protein